MLPDPTKNCGPYNPLGIVDRQKGCQKKFKVNMLSDPTKNCGPYNPSGY